jgi:hypothetical protein
MSLLSLLHSSRHPRAQRRRHWQQQQTSASSPSSRSRTAPRPLTCLPAAMSYSRGPRASHCTATPGATSGASSKSWSHALPLTRAVVDRPAKIRRRRSSLYPPVLDPTPTPPLRPADTRRSSIPCRLRLLSLAGLRSDACSTSSARLLLCFGPDRFDMAASA